MKILFIAPLPPPITGHSLASQVFLDSISGTHDVRVVNFSKDGFKEGVTNFKRFWDIAKVLVTINRKRKHVDIIYLTISESFAGNLKDLLTYLICYRNLSRFFIHLHGGSIGKVLFDRYSFLKKINAFFIHRMGGVIILGKSHTNIFNGMIEPHRVHTVPNFSEEFFFASNEQIISKFNSDKPLKILYLSNLIEGKGYLELLEAFEILTEDERRNIQIDFAGAFESTKEKNLFLDRIVEHPAITYHDIVQGEKKQNLLKGAHVFCLPTGFFEGQPISILEAYASGCIVLTTMMGGIVDIFTDEVHGFKIEEKSAKAVKIALQKSLANKGRLLEIGLNNSREAEKRYRPQAFNHSLHQIMGIN